MGIHGEPGVAREPLKNADAVTDEILDRIFTEMPAKPGDKVALLVNSLGSTPLMELYVLNRRVRQRLDAKGIKHPCDLGRKLLHLAGDGRRVDLADVARRRADPVARSSLRLRHVPRALTWRLTTRYHSLVANQRADSMNDFVKCDLVDIFQAIAAAIEATKGRLSELDGVIGDADHGVTDVDRLCGGRRGAGPARPGKHRPYQRPEHGSEVFLNAVGASPGPLYATGLMRAGAVMKGRTTLDRDAIVDIIAAVAKGIQDRGKAERGDKTMVDVWVPAAEAAEAARAADKDLGDVPQGGAGRRPGWRRSDEIHGRVERPRLAARRARDWPRGSRCRLRRRHCRCHCAGAAIVAVACIDRQAPFANPETERCALIRFSDYASAAFETARRLRAEGPIRETGD